jgi:hypothetical protein
LSHAWVVVLGVSDAIASRFDSIVLPPGASVPRGSNNSKSEEILVELENDSVTVIGYIPPIQMSLIHDVAQKVYFLVSVGPEVVQV